MIGAPERLSPSRAPRLTYQPALDGIRGVAVAAVVAFHGGWGWARGGFLGVSVFFTLSGYLITSLVVVERHTTGGLSLRRFWGRRVRRLLPASLACIAGVIVLSATVLTATRARLPGDVLAAVLDVANWHFYARGDSYGDLFAVPSPLAHFWSLAIEEQFYLLFPPLVWWLLVRRRASVVTLGWVLGGLGAGAVVASVAIGTDNADLVYYATFTRAAELLSGCVLAVVLVRRPLPTDGPVARAVGGAGVVALGVVVALFVTVDQRDAWLYQGGLAAFSLVSVALVAGALVPGPLRRLLAVRPLVALGAISYGVYLYHWPIDLVLTPARTGRTGWALFALRVAVTLAVAIASYVLLEQPIRRRRALVRRSAPLVALGGAAAVVVGALAVGAGAGPDPAEVAAAAERPAVTLPPLPATTVTTGAPVATSAAAVTVPRSASSAAPDTAAPATSPPATEPPPPARIMVFGDSTAKVDAAGLMAWGTETGRAFTSDAGTIAGCGLRRGGRVRFGAQVVTIPAGCRDWDTRWPKVLAANPADIAVVMTGTWDVSDHQLPGDGTWRAPGDPQYDEALAADLLAATDVLLGQGVRVVWVTAAPVDVNWADADEAIDDPARIARLNELIAATVAQRPGVGLVDLAGWLAAQPGAPLADPSLRPDGVHFTAEGSRWLADWWGPAILAAAGP